VSEMKTFFCENNEQSIRLYIGSWFVIVMDKTKTWCQSFDQDTKQRYWNINFHIWWVVLCIRIENIFLWLY